MRLLLACLGLATLAASAAEPTERHYSKPAVRKEIVATVEGQLAAFRANDFSKAYEFAAQGLRERLSADEFAVMITRGYPLILQNERAEFGLPQDDGTSAAVSVQVFARGGKSASYRYLLVKEAGGWRIGGVTPEKPRASDA